MMGRAIGGVLLPYLPPIAPCMLSLNPLWCQGQSVSANFVANFIVALTPSLKLFSTPENAFCIVNLCESQFVYSCTF